MRAPQVLRVPEKADPGRALAALAAIDDARLRRMRAAMATAARLLDYGPRGRLAEAVLARFVRVSRGELPAVPRSTKTPVPVLKL